MLKAGTQTGSLVNHLYSRMTRGAPEPEVGMGVTFLSWTDRSPGTVQRVWVENGLTHIEVTADGYQRTDKNGLSEMQTYEYTQKPDGYRATYRLSAKGAWERRIFNPETNRWRKGEGGLRVGEREKYHDPCF